MSFGHGISFFISSHVRYICAEFKQSQLRRRKRRRTTPDDSVGVHTRRLGALWLGLATTAIQNDRPTMLDLDNELRRVAR